MARFLPTTYTLQSASIGQTISHDFLHRVMFVSSSSPEQSLGVDDSGRLYIKLTPSYASNALAIAGGLAVGTVYRNGDALQIVH